MTKIKLTVFVLIMLGASSCKQESSNKDASSSTIESPVLRKKVNNPKEAKEQIVKPIEKAKDCNQTFDAFFERFAKDSVFQKNNVQFPLKYTHYSDVTSDEPTEEYLNGVTYLFIDFSMDKEASNLTYDKFTIEKVEAENTVVYKRIGMDNGIRETYTFGKQKECWFLVEILNEST